MKVVHLCNVALPPEHPDHARLSLHPGRWVLNLALAQKAHTSVEPELLMQVPGASRDHFSEIEGIPVHFVAAPDRLRSATLFAFDARRMAARARALRPDFVHAHGTEDCYSLAAQRTGLPYVITAQGLIFLINRVVPPRLISRDRAVEFVERRTLRRARHVIAKSDYVADALRAEFPHLQIHRIANTIDPRLLEIREEKERGVLAFVGVIHPRKGLDLLATALAEVRRTHPEVRLWIFGDKPAGALPYETALKTQLHADLGECLVFHGTIPAIEVARKVSRAVALVAPSREEMFGNQLVEALTVGTHGIVTEGTAMAENVCRFGNGTVVPQEDAAALAQAIVTAVEATAFPEAATARARLLDFMGPETVACQHEALYRQLLAS
jgi:glycosyltransferase involved in cell wall biosynthesis